MTRTAVLIALFSLIVFSRLDAQPDLPIDSLVNRADKLAKEGPPDAAVNVFLQLLKAAEKENRHDLLAPAYYNLATISHFQNNAEKSKEYHAKALHYSRLYKDTSNLARTIFLSGIFEFLADRPDSSIRCFQECIDLYMAIGERNKAAVAMSKIGNIYEGQGKFAEATPIFEQYLQTAEQARDTFMLMLAYMNIGTNALNLKSYEKALKWMKLAGEFAYKVKRSYEYQEALKYQSVIYEKMGKPQQSLDVLRQYVQHHDSTLNVERTRQITEMETRFETEKKENTITLQAEALRQERLRFWLIAGVLALALAAGVGLFRLTRILRRRNTEKEFLIKEIHHRVKNNLQILSSLLHLQSRQITDEAALDAVREGQNRVDAMGLIHQKLYMGDNIAAVDMTDYLKHLGSTLLDSFGFDDDRVQIHYAIQPIRLDVDTAVPLGLIITELLTNSFKYAFPGDRAGRVEVALWTNEAGKLCLKVADDGVGRAGAPVLKGSTSFGASLVQMLSKKLKGVPQISDEGEGYSTLMAFEQYKIV